MIDELLSNLDEVLRTNLGPPLKAFHQPIDAWLASLPMWVAMGCAMALFISAIVWVWCLRRDFVFRGAADRTVTRDLRIWATVVVVPYIAIYLWLGR